MQYTRQDMQDLLDKYEADNLTELAGKLMDAAYKESPALMDMLTMTSAMWATEHPVDEEMRTSTEGRNNALSYICYLWGCKEQTVTLDGEESNPRWDKHSRIDSIEAALNGVG